MILMNYFMIDAYVKIDFIHITYGKVLFSILINILERNIKITNSLPLSSNQLAQEFFQETQNAALCEPNTFKMDALLQVCYILYLLIFSLCMNTSLSCLHLK